EAEVLLRHVLGLTREVFFQRLADPLSPGTLEAYEAVLRRRLGHEPTAYIIGRREFFGLEFEVGPGALIPRPETELLVEAAIEIVNNTSTLPGPDPHPPPPGSGRSDIADLPVGA